MGVSVFFLRFFILMGELTRFSYRKRFRFLTNSPKSQTRSVLSSQPYQQSLVACGRPSAFRELSAWFLCIRLRFRIAQWISGNIAFIRLILKRWLILLNLFFLRIVFESN